MDAKITNSNENKANPGNYSTQGFTGDPDFLDGLVSKVYEFGHGRVREHLCGIYEFLESKKMESLQELEKKQ